MPISSASFRSSTGAVAIAVVLVSALSALGVVGWTGVARARELAGDEAAVQAGRLATALTTDVGLAERQLIDLVQQAAVVSPADLVRGRRGEQLVGVAWVVDSRGGLRLAAGSPLAMDLVASQTFEVATIQARDREDVILVSPEPGWPGPLVVAPVYEVGGTLLGVSGSQSTSVRRDRLAGFLVGVLDPVTGLGEFGRPFLLADGDSVIAESGSRSGASGTAPVDVGLRRWVLTTWQTPDLLAGDAILVLVAVTILGVFGFGALVLERRRRVIVLSEVQAERERNAVIADLAPTLQRSLELEDILPVVAVQLTDRFGLAGVSVVTAGDTDGEVFAHGVRPDPHVAATVELSGHLEAGATAALALTRAGRLVAELRLRAGEALEDRDLQSIQASAELMTSAIVTAQALDRQRRAVEQLTELDAVKNVFLTTAAHELRTPVAAIKGFGSLLRDQWSQLGDDERKLMASRVAANADGLNALVQDLLDFSRLETGRLGVAPEPLELAGFVDGIVDRLSAAWSGHELTVDAEPGPPIMGDPVALERVLTNLLSNAARYSPPGTTITVRVHHERGDAVLTVDDEGPGVPADERDRIFNRFYRGSSAAVIQTRGVGIGLAVVREYIRQLGATVDVTDSPGGGARFRCRFPHLRHPEPATGVATEGATR